MEYTRLGASGLKISRIALGCMGFGDTSGGFSGWALETTGPLRRASGRRSTRHLLGHRERSQFRTSEDIDPSHRRLNTD